MADVVEVVARLGDTIVAIAHGPRVTIGDTRADIYAPASRRTFALEASSDAIVVGAPISTTAGLLTIEIRRVAAAADRVARKRLEGRPAAYIAISLLVHLVLWDRSMRASSGDASIALHVGVVGAVPVRMTTPRDAPPPIPPSVDDTPKPTLTLEPTQSPNTVVSDKSGNGIGPISEIVGHAGVDMIERPSPVDGRAARTSTAKASGAERRDHAIAAARNAGILGADSLRGERPLGDIPGTGEPAAGFDGRAINGAARGESAQQTFASDRRLVGGCTHEPCGGIGTGRYATVCAGPTPDAACGRGTGDGYGMAPRVSLVPTVRICSASPDGTVPNLCIAIAGDLDKAIIRRYIRRKIPALTGCYEKQLLVDTRLTGAVDTNFLIDPTGHVRDMKATGTNPEVTSCIATVISTIQFPLSRNGGSTQVHYPFSFLFAGG